MLLQVWPPSRDRSIPTVPLTSEDDQAMVAIEPIVQLSPPLGEVTVSAGAALAEAVAEVVGFGVMLTSPLPPG